MKTDPTPTFAELLRHYRERAGLSQEALAEKAGLSSHAISALERGERQRPYPNTLRLLAEALGLAEDEREILLRSVRIAAVSTASTLPKPAAAVERQPVPQPLTRLVGRAAEAGVVQQLLLRPDLRLLTLTGPGGVGKTRLSIEVAQLCRPAFPDGVVFVSLAPVHDPDLVLTSIVQSLGLDETGGLLPLQSLTTWLREKQALLVLDNFEHLAQAALQVVNLLQKCPGLKALVTSREALHVRGEQEYLVPPLAFPSTGEALSHNAALQFDAIRLFVQCAQSVRPGFTLDDGNAAVVAQICRRLDGLPLAIELAAARIGLLSPAALLARLDQQLQVLVGGPRDLPDRQQTMRQTIAWSYDLLDEEEQALFRRVAIFSGGASLEAIENVCTEGCEPDGSIFLPIESLARKNLLQVNSEDDQVRVHLLETIRAYGIEQLTRLGELEGLRSAHADYFLALAERAQPGLTAAEQVEWYPRLSLERNNLRVAATTWLQSGDWELVIRFTWALWRFWWVRGMHAEARKWSEQALAEIEPGCLDPLRQAQAELTIGSMAWISGEYDLAIRRCRTAVDLSAGQTDERTRLVGPLMLGVNLLSYGNYVEAGQNFEVVRDIFPPGGSQTWCLAFATNYLGFTRFLQGQVETGLRLLDEGQKIARQSGDRIVFHQSLYNLAVAEVVSGDVHAGLRAFADGLAVAMEVGDSANAGYFLRGIAEIGLRLAGSIQAVELLSAALALLASIGADRVHYSMEQDRLDQSLDLAHEIGGKSFETHWQTGRKWPIQEAYTQANNLAGALLEGKPGQ